MSTIASGVPPIARTSDDVRHHRGRAGAERVRLEERRRHRLAAHDQVPVAVRDRGGVVAVDAEPLDDLQVTLAEQPGRVADGRDEIFHPSHSKRPRDERAARGLRGQSRALDVRRRAAGAGRAGRRRRLAPAGGRRRRRRSRCSRGCGARTATRSPRPTRAPSPPSRARRRARSPSRPARDVVPGAARRPAAPFRPADQWDRVCDPQRRALVAAVLFEGWEPDRESAAAALERGDIALEPGNEHDHVGPMTGVCSPSMPVWVVEDGSRRAFSTLNEGPGKTLWFGVGDDESDRAAAVLPRRTRSPPGVVARAPRTGRRLRPRRPGAEHGRRTAHAQPGHRQPAAARPRRRRSRRSAARTRRSSSPATTTSSSTSRWRRPSARRWPRRTAPARASSR